MSARSIIVLLLALIVGGSAAGAVALYVNREQAADEAGEMKSVVVALRDLQVNETVSDDSVEIIEVAADKAHSLAFQTLEGPVGALNRRVLLPIKQGDILIEGAVSSDLANLAMARRIPLGMRVTAIHTPHVASGLAGFVLPGNKVDILLTVTDLGRDDNTGGASTTTLLQNIEVVAVNQYTDAPAENKIDPQTLRSVTVIGTPQQIAKINLAQSMGQIALSLRNPDDESEAEVKPTTLKDIRFSQESPLALQARGVAESVNKFFSGPSENRTRRFSPNPKKKPPLVIRTLRGRENSVVKIQVD